MPTTYAIAFAAHRAPDSTFRPRDTMLRARDTMNRRPTMLRAGDPTISTTTKVNGL